MSSLLFNTVLQFSLESDPKRWQEKQKGIRLSDKKRRLPDELEIRTRCITFLDVAGEITRNGL